MLGQVALRPGRGLRIVNPVPYLRKKRFENLVRIVRAGRAFGVELNAIDRPVLHPEAFQRAVVERKMGHLHFVWIE